MKTFSTVVAIIFASLHLWIFASRWSRIIFLWVKPLSHLLMSYARTNLCVEWQCCNTRRRVCDPSLKARNCGQVMIGKDNVSWTSQIISQITNPDFYSFRTLNGSKKGVRGTVKQYGETKNKIDCSSPLSQAHPQGSSWPTGEQWGCYQPSGGQWTCSEKGDSTECFWHVNGRPLEPRTMEGMTNSRRYY